MRLICVFDLTFREILPQGPFPDYAILSHTWITPSNQEVSFRDILAFHSPSSAEVCAKPGWRKIEFTIAAARQQSLEYVWVDTCCINREDPAELAEAINSMFSWYKKATVCYSYITDADVSTLDRSRSYSNDDGALESNESDYASDAPVVLVESGTTPKSHLASNQSRWAFGAKHKWRERVDSVLTPMKELGFSERCLSLSDDDIEALLRKCRWIERGWTLQELLAPPAVQFYDVSWTLFTTRSASAVVLSRITGINEDALRDSVIPASGFARHGTLRDQRLDLQQYSVAQRMCWAANRQTTRAEDRAYSLFGLFGVGMPLLYGEGEERAFARLQEEIIKSSSDQSIFAWVCSSHAAGLLACDPECFRKRSHVVPRRGTSAFHPRRQQRSSAGYFMSNRGLQISLPLLSTRLGYIHQAVLNCRSMDDPARVYLLTLYHVEGNEYCVIDGHQPRCTDIDWWRLPATNRTDTSDKQDIVIRRSWAEFFKDNRAGWELILRLEDTVGASSGQSDLVVHSVYPAKSWSNDKRYYQGPSDTVSGAFVAVGAICLSYGSSEGSEEAGCLFLTFTHEGKLGKSLLWLQIAEGAFEETDGLEDACQYGTTLQQTGRNRQVVQGYYHLDVALTTQDGSTFKVALQEIDILGDAVWELKVARLTTAESDNKHTSSSAYPDIWEEISAPLERLEVVPSDNSWIRYLPTGCTILSAVGYGSSYWSRHGRIEVRLSDGSIKEYFIKFSESAIGRHMSEGQYESMRLLHIISPELVPHPVGWGSLDSQKDMHFLLCDFEHMHDKVPSMRDLCTSVASLHSRSQAYSPNGHFGFNITTCNGTFPQYTTWSKSWETFFIESLKEGFALEQSVQGFSQEIADLLPPLLEKVCPRLLRPLETEGRILRPTLVHGDLWDRNTGVLTKSGEPCIFDSSALWAHNEYELHSWRGDSFEIGGAFAKEYLKHFPASAPEKDWEDRNLLYALMTDLHESYLFRATDKFRRFLINNMKTLVEKFPDGYQGTAQCKAEEDALADGS